MDVARLYWTVPHFKDLDIATLEEQGKMSVLFQSQDKLVAINQQSFEQYMIFINHGNSENEGYTGTDLLHVNKEELIKFIDICNRDDLDLLINFV